jgi:hypothetical protein
MATPREDDVTGFIERCTKTYRRYCIKEKRKRGNVNKTTRTRRQLYAMRSHFMSHVRNRLHHITAHFFDLCPLFGKIVGRTWNYN